MGTELQIGILNIIREWNENLKPKYLKSRQKWILRKSGWIYDLERNSLSGLKYTNGKTTKQKVGSGYFREQKEEKKKKENLQTGHLNLELAELR